MSLPPSDLSPPVVAVIEVLGQVVALILAEILPLPMANTFWPGMDTSPGGLSDVSISDSFALTGSAQAAVAGVEAMMTVTSTTTTKTVPGFISLEESIIGNSDGGFFPPALEAVGDVAWPGPRSAGAATSSAAASVWSDPFSPVGTDAQPEGSQDGAVFLEVIGPCDGSHTRAACDAAGGRAANSGVAVRLLFFRFVSCRLFEAEG